MSLPPVLGRLVIRLVRELEPRSCLELGTGFGISTAYQAAALDLNGTGGLISLDVGDITKLAQPGLERLGLGGRVELVPGLIEETLASACERAAPIDFALLDADHTEEGTVGAFDAIAPGLSGGAIVVCDDVNWTDDMRRAWRTIAARGRVSATVTLRRLGIAIVAGRVKPGAHIRRSPGRISFIDVSSTVCVPNTTMSGPRSAPQRGREYVEPSTWLRREV